MRITKKETILSKIKYYEEMLAKETCPRERAYFKNHIEKLRRELNKYSD